MSDMSWDLVPLLLAVIAVAAGALVARWLRKVVRVALSVRRHAAYWAVPRGEAGGLRYVALGDSAAQGIGASRPERGYVGLLAQRMREQTGRPVQVMNLSRSGATLADLVEDQLPLLAGLQADVVTVAIGGNDIRSYDAARFASQVCALTEGLPRGAVVADVPYFMHGHWERDAVEAGQVLAACAEANGHRIARLHDLEQARGSAAMLTDFAADWFHPNDRGHRVWADAFWTQLLRSEVLATSRPDAEPELPARGDRA